MIEEMIPKSTLDSICASAHYREAQMEVKRATAVCENEARYMELARIRCRLAELRSQHEPLGSLLTELGFEINTPQYDAMRRQLWRAAFYAVYGRMTDQ